MEKDYCSVSKKFWQTIQCLRRGKEYSANTFYSVDRDLLTSTGNIIRWWKKYFKEPLNPVVTLSTKAVEAGDSEDASAITQW